MQVRPNPYELSPDIGKHGLALQQAIDAVGLDKTLLILIQIRVSQLNGCAFCINMHTREAKRLGVSETRIYLLDAWHESTLFDERERALLAWTEALSRIATHGPPADNLFDALKLQFSDREIVGITSAVAMIHYWNRLAIGSKAVSPFERK